MLPYYTKHETKMKSLNIFIEFINNRERGGNTLSRYASSLTPLMAWLWIIIDQLEKATCSPLRAGAKNNCVLCLRETRVCTLDRNIFADNEVDDYQKLFNRDRILYPTTRLPNGLSPHIVSTLVLCKLKEICYFF